MGWQGSATRRSIDGSKSTTYNTYINPVGEGVDGVEGAGVGKAPKRSSSRSVLHIQIEQICDRCGAIFHLGKL